MKKSKKGFTLIELIIVIAVIGILSGVLIPVFTNLTSKAQGVTDDALIKNLNTLMQVHYVGDEDNYFDETINYLETQGVTVESINSKVGKDVVYDSINHKFVMFNTTDNPENAYQYIKIYDEVPILDEQKYSIYLAGNDHEGDVKVKVGFDCGKNTSLDNIRYETDASQTVTIHTSGESTLTINAPHSKVYHYGNNNGTTIEAVDDSSFYEYGDSPIISLNSGRLVLEPESNVLGLVIESNDAIVASALKTAIPSNISSSKAKGASSNLDFKIQETDKEGNTLKEANVTYNGSEVNIDGELSDIIASDLEDAILNPAPIDSSVIESKYTAKLYSSSALYYYDSIYDAFNDFNNHAASINLYLLKDTSVDESVIFANAKNYAKNIYLCGHTLKGNNCTPLIVQPTSTAKKAIIIYGYSASDTTLKTGALVGDDTHDAIINRSASYILSLNTVNTYGKVTTTGYLTKIFGTGVEHFNGGTEWNKDFLIQGIFDFDVTPFVNPYLNKATQSDSKWTLSTITQDSTLPLVSYIDSAHTVRYPNFATMMQYVGQYYSSYNVRVYKNITEDIVCDKKLTMTIYSNNKIFTGSINASGKALVLNTRGASYKGTFNISNLQCAALTVSAYSIVNVTNSGTVTGALTISGDGTKATLNVANVAFTSTSSITATNGTVTINGGSFTGALTISGANNNNTISNASFAGAVTLSASDSTNTFTGVSVTGAVDFNAANANNTLTDVSFASTTKLRGSNAVFTINNNCTFTGAVSIYGASGQATIENGTFNGAVSIYGSLCNVTINNGTFNKPITYGTTSTSTTYSSGTTINITGGTFNGNITKSGSKDHTITVTGGTYKNSTVYNTIMGFIPSGYTCTQSGSKYVVGPVTNS